MSSAARAELLLRKFVRCVACCASTVFVARSRALLGKCFLGRVARCLRNKCPGENGQQAKHTFTDIAVSPAHNGHWMHHFVPLFAPPVQYASAENRNQVRPMATMCSATRPLVLSNKNVQYVHVGSGFPTASSLTKASADN